MTHKIRHKQLKNVNRKYKNLAGIVAVATLLSTTALPAMPTTIAHASASLNSSNMSATTSQQVGKTNDSGIQINFTPSVVAPTKETKVLNTSSNLEKASVTTSKPAQPANPNVQPVSNVTKTSPDSAPTNYKEVLDIKATAYAPGPHDNDQWGNKTYIGSQVRPGIIAVDPNVIPLGSRVYIQYPDGHGEYAVAEDTGGAIKGNRVDIAKWTVNEAEDFGIQNVKVFVVNTPEKI